VVIYKKKLVDSQARLKRRRRRFRRSNRLFDLQESGRNRQHRKRPEQERPPSSRRGEKRPGSACYSILEEPWPRPIVQHPQRQYEGQQIEEVVVPGRGNEKH